MPRQSRLRAAGIPWHIRQRGTNGIACFAADEDRELYLGLLGELAAAARCHVHAYVLMTNHVHLLLTAEDADAPSQLMNRLGGQYAWHFNRRRGRYGTLWEGRFRSSPVDSDEYLITCQRYVELNPVRAAMVSHPRDYPWSSYRANAEGQPSLIVRPHILYEALGPDPESRQRSYRTAFDAPMSSVEVERIRDAVNSGFALGNRDFLERLRKALGRKVERGVSGRPRRRKDATVDTESMLQLTL